MTITLKQTTQVGIKQLVLCDDREFAYNFQIYSGIENNPDLIIIQMNFVRVQI